MKKFMVLVLGQDGKGDIGYFMDTLEGLCDVVIKHKNSECLLFSYEKEAYKLISERSEKK